jgi:hypothetical protein
MILRCDKLPPLKEISSQDFGKLGLGIELKRLDLIRWKK